MRKHDPRKWLHAVLDLLPVIIIPVFMIYSHRHTIDNYEIEVSQNEVVDFNQRFNYDGDYINNSFYTSKNNGSFIWEDFTIPSTNRVLFDYYPFQLNHVYYVKNLLTEVISSGPLPRVYYNGSYHTLSYNSDLYFNFIFTANDTRFTFGFGSNYNGQSFSNHSIINFYDLTQMFGAGNEPTIEQFNEWYSNEYYDYTLSRKELLKDVSTTTYNNTDIGSQLVYAIYTPVHDYMNFNNVFNFGAIYDWLQLNIFSGNAPVSVFIVWNIFLYEFLMDLIFLLYALFMFFVDFCTNLIDRFHTKCSGRG